MSALEILKHEDGYWLSIDGEIKALISISSTSPMVLRAIEEAVETSRLARSCIDKASELKEENNWDLCDETNQWNEMEAELAQLRNRIAELKENAELFIKYIKNGESQKSHLQMLVLESFLTNLPEPPK
jgi:chromosome segregation ATPase